MGVDVNTFNKILHPFEELWNVKPIPQGDVKPHGKPQLARRLLDAAGCLGLVLHWLCSTMPGYLLQQLFAITPAVCSRYLDLGLQHLLTALKSLRSARIVWSSTERAIRPCSHSIEKKFPLLKGCFGFFNGLNLLV